MVANIVLVTIGLMLFLFSEHQINRMTKRTRKIIRLAFSLNALSGVCFAAQPLFPDMPAVHVAVAMALSGTALLIIANRRKGCIFGCRQYDAFWSNDTCARQRRDVG